jgi:hypothetical protein
MARDATPPCDPSEGRRGTEPAPSGTADDGTVAHDHAVALAAEVAAEQAHLDHAYACLERSRDATLRLTSLNEAGPGGTHQARYERDVIAETVRSRLGQLELGDHALVFGRIDVPAPDDAARLEAFHIGRVAVADEHNEPVVVDWRAPVAAPFYRATGRDPMGLVRRRHFTVDGRRILDLEDELFGAAAGGPGAGPARPEGIRGYGALMATLERSRGGALGDIVATIQAEQDEIIRAPQSGVLVVQGGPGTGKTVVALHRAAYLLYTHRFPLEDQGVLVIGPNRLFLRYISRVLPSLGEAGVEQVVLGDLVPDVRFGGTDRPSTARVKGSELMADVVAKAVRDRERPLRQRARVPFGSTYLTLDVAESERIVTAAKRRFRRHNPARRFVEQEVFAALALSSRDEVSAAVVRERTRHLDEVRVLLERMWPVLTPAQLLHDLFGSKALLRLAGRNRLSEDEVELLFRERSDDLADVRWSDADAALLDEAREALGPVPSRRAARAVDAYDTALEGRPSARGRLDEEIRTYGHIVIDEAQDLSPMQLRMAARRSLNGNLTVVGDIAQATGPFAPAGWDDITDHLPDRRPTRVVELSVGYRVPAQVMGLANRVLRAAAPGLTPPAPVRDGDLTPRVYRAPLADGAEGPGGPDPLAAAVATAIADARDALGEPSVAVICPASLVESIADGLEAAGEPVGRAVAAGLSRRVTVVAVGMVKGLELDVAVVVEPGAIVREEIQGLRALYVALTRPTKHLALVHQLALPGVLAD